MKHKRAKYQMVLVSCLLLVTGACAGSAGGEGGIDIGAIVPLSGELAAVGEPTQQQIEWVVETVNASGLNACGDIRLSVQDQGNPEDAIRAADQVINDDDVVAIVGTTSHGTVAIAERAVTEEVVLFSPSGGSVTLDELGGDFVYRSVPSDVAAGEVGALWMTDKGYERPAYMILNEESPQSQGEITIETMEARGVATAAEVIFNPGQASYQGELSAVLEAGPDVIFLAGGLESGSTVIREAIAAGYDEEWYLTSDMSVQEVVDTVGSDIMGEQFYGAIPSPDESLEGYARWRAAFDEEFGGEPGPYAPNSYDAMTIIALAMIGPQEGCDGPAINANIRQVTDGGTPVYSYEEGAALLLEGEDIDYEGASGPLELDETGTPAGSYSVLQVQDGIWESVEFYPATAFTDS